MECLPWTTWMLINSFKKLGGTRATDAALTGVATHGPHCVRRYVRVSRAEHQGGVPHRGQCRSGHGKELGCCLEPQLVVSFLSGFLWKLRKVDSALADQFTKVKIDAYFLRSEDGQQGEPLSGAVAQKPTPSSFPMKCEWRSPPGQQGFFH